MATTNYPASIDNYAQPNNGDTISVADHWLAPAIIAVENELGTDPAGYATDVKTRLDDINPSEGNLNLDAGYGSKAPIYGVRAWVNFNGAGTVAIRESGNVSSVTDHGVGAYTINFSTAMPDANYCATGSGSLQLSPSSSALIEFGDNVITTSGIKVATRSFSAVRIDPDSVFVAIHR